MSGGMTVFQTGSTDQHMKAFALIIGLTITAMPLTCRAQPVESALITKAGEIESRLGARVGLAVYDTGHDTSWLYHADERFPLTSTFKAFACAALLHRVDDGQTTLDRTVRISQSDLVPYAPVMEHLVRQDVSLQHVCAAALRLSDNVAGNKVLDSIGGPTELTDYMRSIGDTVTRLDRCEPELNEATPGDRRDTTTPAAVANSLRRLVLGDSLSAWSRQQLTAWLVADEVGGPLLRASLPTEWRIADRTGAGGHGSRGIVAVMWPPGRAPIVAAMFLTGTDATMDQRNRSIAELGAALVADVTKQNR